MEFFYSPCHKENLTDKKKNFKINLINLQDFVGSNKFIFNGLQENNP